MKYVECIFTCIVSALGFLLQMSARALVGLLAEDVAYGASVIIFVGLILFCIIVINNPSAIPDRF